ncbi:MAG: GNAT family N-acetyltransferase [Geminicoccaceae bacterium]|nr:GNAT family N-acetyltransferase [Geminicoccaceae bacterium]
MPAFARAADDPATRPVKLRPPRAHELPALTGLVLRSKAHWGYDHTFIEACRAELSLTPETLTGTRCRVAERQGRPVGVAQLALHGEEAELLKLFVEPAALGTGIGHLLFAWAEAEARTHGARRLRIESDPAATAFYERMGAIQVGTAPSGSIPGRMLPLLMRDLGG